MSFLGNFYSLQISMRSRLNRTYLSSVSPFAVRLSKNLFDFFIRLIVALYKKIRVKRRSGHLDYFYGPGQGTIVNVKFLYDY